MECPGAGKKYSSLRWYYPDQVNGNDSNGYNLSLFSVEETFKKFHQQGTP
jgi:hypothetical protein